MTPAEAIRLSEKMTADQRAFWNAGLIVAADAAENVIYALSAGTRAYGTKVTQEEAVEYVTQLRNDIRSLIAT